MLIAEIGNNHCGDIKKAKALIRAAVESGADLVKSQAFVAQDVAKTGSMPLAFYQQCQFNMWEHLELMEYAKAIGTELFYSIFSPEYQILEKHQRYRKVAANQVGKRRIVDTEDTIVSIGTRSKTFPKLKNAFILHATEYLSPTGRLERIVELQDIYERPIGLSDHTIGTKASIGAIEHYGCLAIEKHFILKEDLNRIIYKTSLFRDSLHAATPNQFEKIANKLRSKF